MLIGERDSFGTILLSMLHIYFGSDVSAARSKACAVAADTEKSVTRIEAETYVPQQITDSVRSVSLFGDCSTYIIDTPSLDEIMNQEVLACATEMAESLDVFIIIEGPLLAAPKKKWLAHASMSEEFSKGPAARFDVFRLAESLLQRDKKSLWMLLCDARTAGLASEEIIGTLWWQLKTLRVADCTNTAAEAGMKEYPYNKAKRALRNFKAGELESLSTSLLAVYHDGHGGVRDIELGLEEWVLRG